MVGILLFPWIGFINIRSAEEIIYTDTIEIRQLIGIVQRQRPLTPLILGIQRLVAHKILCYLLLF